MLKKISSHKIPFEFKFIYEKNYREMIKLRFELDGFEPQNEEEKAWVDEKLNKYKECFMIIHEINESIA